MNYDQSNTESIRPISCSDLYDILKDLEERRLLGTMELSREGACQGHVDVYPELLAALITHAAALSRGNDFTSVSLSFEREQMTLRICGIGAPSEAELSRLAKQGHLAGFESRYSCGELRLFVTVRQSTILKIYAVKPAWLKNLFESCFDGNKIARF